MKKRTELQSQTLTGLFAIGITALFLAGFLTLVVFGAKAYRATVAGQRDNNELRSQLSYISTMCKSMDASGAVTVYAVYWQLPRWPRTTGRSFSSSMDSSKSSVPIMIMTLYAVMRQAASGILYITSSRKPE